MDTLSHPSIASLQARLPDLMIRDQRRLGRRVAGARKIRRGDARQAALGDIATQVEAAEARVAQRRTAVPAITYPAELPVSQHKDDLLAAIRDNQVVIVAGETGSGKTTQLPKICLELGRGVRGVIGHTQPRRIAARTVAERIASELDTPLGETVGWKIRFTDRVGEATMVKVMTDGILLAEIQSDRMLADYDTLIIDEAHERSLNIDFILGYVKQLLPRRPDLKVVITSATIDPERFSRHFDDAPVVEVSGRTYPVEVRYRPIVEDADDRDRDQIQAICDAVDELDAEAPGDILVFASGEREIRDTADALTRQNLRNTEVLPLYARLSAADQHRVFQSHTGRRIVVATNVAETSLTVPGIKYVIDPGTARISRYSNRLKVQRLPIEAISQASANQRKGRCGRTSDGICIRLYAEDDFLSRPEFTEPEIVRTNLASVILAMAAARLGDIAAFPFIDAPDARNVKAGVQLLEELGALDDRKRNGGDGHAGHRLTATGRTLSQLPVDPRLARMIVAAQDNGCVREVMIIAAALSIQDPRERPVDKEQAADQLHARFADEHSDFVAFLNLWAHLREKQKELSSNQFRKLCRAEFVNYLRVREWQDIVSQLRQVARTVGITQNTTPADAERIHRSLLAGLLSHVGLKDADQKDPGRKDGQRSKDSAPATSGRRQRFEYLGARGAKFAIFPGSALFKKPPAWVMAAELVETSRLWGRIVARIEPEWAEEQAQHLVKRTYSEPHWSKRQRAVLAYEKVTLYGVPLVAQRRVNYGRIDRETSRALFIRHALVQGEWETHHEFFAANRALLEEAEDLEHRVRRRDIVVDDETLYAFYDERIGPDVVSGAHFDSWWKKVRRDKPDLLTFTASMLVNDSAAELRSSDYPDVWTHGGHRLGLSYEFDPGSAADGVTVHVPLAVLNQVADAGFDWQVPGLREELVTALLRSLPKPLRRLFVPAPEFARAVLDRVTPYDGQLLPAMERVLRELTGVHVPREAWQLDRLPAHLTMRFAVVEGPSPTGADAPPLAEGKDLDDLRTRLRGKLALTLADAADGVEREGLRSWTFGPLERTVSRRRDGLEIRAYPALSDEGSSVAIRVFETEAEQRRAMRRGTRRLLLLNLPSPVKYVLAELSNAQKLALSNGPHGSAGALFDDCVDAAVDSLVGEAGGPVWEPDGFGRLQQAVRAKYHDAVSEVVAAVAEILTAAHDVEARLEQLGRTTNRSLAPALDDVREQLARLVFPGFVTVVGRGRLPDVLRYLRAAARRLDKLAGDTGRDAARMQTVRELWGDYSVLAARYERLGGPPPAVEAIRWMIEELRVSYFAQVLGTPAPVSDKRIRKAIDEVPL